MLNHFTVHLLRQNLRRLSLVLNVRRHQSHALSHDVRRYARTCFIRHAHFFPQYLLSRFLGLNSTVQPVASQSFAPGFSHPRTLAAYLRWHASLFSWSEYGISSTRPSPPSAP